MAHAAARTDDKEVLARLQRVLFEDLQGGDSDEWQHGRLDEGYPKWLVRHLGTGN